MTVSFSFKIILFACFVLEIRKGWYAVRNSRGLSGSDDFVKKCSLTALRLREVHLLQKPDESYDQSLYPMQQFKSQ